MLAGCKIIKKSRKGREKEEKMSAIYLLYRQRGVKIIYIHKSAFKLWVKKKKKYIPVVSSTPVPTGWFVERSVPGGALGNSRPTNMHNIPPQTQYDVT